MNGEQFVELRDGDRRMAGILHLPTRGTPPFPVVIYCPGKNGERYEVHRLAVKLARRLADEGVAMLRFDYCGLGLSDGHYYDMTTSSKVSNVLKAWDEVRRRPELDSGRTAYLGFSDGARIALMAAERSGVDRVVLWSPLFYEFGGAHPSGKRPRFTRHALNKEKLVMPWAGLWISMEFYRDLQELDKEAVLRAYEGRSLLVYGDDDPLIHEEFEKVRTDSYAIYRGDAGHEVCAVQGAGHLFTSRLFEERIMDVTGQWLKRELRASETGEGGIRDVETSPVWPQP
ncbi:acetyltransferase [Paenibacillus tyrfis]|uniref:alpha/beta hydrolase n=1 Tax=Paenibacillus tyrfis TaxID=1501230 RepID=UPI002491CC52|nr:alpha/beta hydrolase [Paenibacillus tyrfis]GLI08262.1 acetyltransferase [Paenibacillus tyrfis]